MSDLTGHAKDLPLVAEVEGWRTVKEDASFLVRHRAADLCTITIRHHGRMDHRWYTGTCTGKATSRARAFRAALLAVTPRRTAGAVHLLHSFGGGTPTALCGEPLAADGDDTVFAHEVTCERCTAHMADQN